MSFFCTYCNVDFKRKHHFNAHLLTKKHLKNKNSFNEKNTQQEVLKKSQKKVNSTPEILENSTTYAPHILSANFVHSLIKVKERKVATPKCVLKKNY